MKAVKKALPADEKCSVCEKELLDIKGLISPCETYNDGRLDDEELLETMKEKGCGCICANCFEEGKTTCKNCDDEEKKPGDCSEKMTVYGVHKFEGFCGRLEHLQQYRECVYYQCWGGGPEGGYIVDKKGKVYEVNRTWGEPFSVEPINAVIDTDVDDEPPSDDENPVKALQLIYT
jgi:hypothetical protein